MHNTPTPMYQHRLYVAVEAGRSSRWGPPELGPRGHGLQQSIERLSQKDISRRHRPRCQLLEQLCRLIMIQDLLSVCHSELVQQVCPGSSLEQGLLLTCCLLQHMYDRYNMNVSHLW